MESFEQGRLVSGRPPEMLARQGRSLAIHTCLFAGEHEHGFYLTRIDAVALHAGTEFGVVQPAVAKVANVVKDFLLPVREVL